MCIDFIDMHDRENNRILFEKLKEFISEVETMKCKRRGVNSKKSLMYERAVKIRDQVESDKDFTRFPSKFKVPH